MIGIVDLPPNIDGLTCDLIRERIGLHGCRGEPTAELDRPESETVHRAAVLLPLFRPEPTLGSEKGTTGPEDPGNWQLLFIRRAVHAHDRHSGEVSFPGGRWEPQDPSCSATALREAQEEIGLDPCQVRLLGELRPMRTLSRFLVTPVVGYIPWPQALRPDPREVSRIFSIPLAWLCEPGNHRVSPYPAPGHPEARDVVFFDEFDGELLWGISARIALDLLGCLLPG
jgi:8-oxo-dGTP pyrophosphatase MutT (NUDIX family)